MSKTQKVIDKADQVLGDARSAPLILAFTQTLALLVYFPLKVLWFFSTILYGEDACTIARNKFNSEIDNK